MNELRKNYNIQVGSNKNFAFTFAFLFLIIGIYLIYKNSNLSYYFLFFSFTFFGLGKIFPNIFKVPNLIWHKFGLLLGSIISPVVMFLIYSLTIVPIGIILKLFGVDILNLNIKKQSTSYWIKSEKKINSLKKQF